MTQKVELPNFLMTMMLLRNEHDDNPVFCKVMKRLLHLWCQSVENALMEGDLLLDECPDPGLRTKMHPYMRHSRRCGNKTIRQALCKDFMARGGGYVTTRHELNLKRLGIVSPKSSLASLASTEFVARQLDLASKWIFNHFMSCDSKPYGFKVVNFTLDESRVAQQQVPRHLKTTKKSFALFSFPHLLTMSVIKLISGNLKAF